jgi:SAM-dependent methyltransferase
MWRANRLEEHRDDADRTRLNEGCSMTENTGANAAQREYWNTVAGPRWVGLGGFVENRVQAVNKLLIASSEITTGENVLEIGCGTGALTVDLAKAVGRSGEVVAVDISEPMLAAARQCIAQTRLQNISLLQADAQVHGFAPNRFDLVASRFGVMFFADPTAAFRNLRAATRPGGRLCFACWGPIEDNRHWLIPYEVALRHLGPPAPKPPHSPGPLALSDPDYVRSILGEAGYDAIEIRREAPEIIGSTPEQETEHACMMGPSGRLIDEKGPDAAVIEKIRREMRQAFAEQIRDGAMLMSSTVFVATARRPQG